jgi:HK97 family phage major capsid protein
MPKNTKKGDNIMKVTTEKLEAFVADRMRYMQGSLDCNRSGIGDPENSAYKIAIDAGLNKRLNATIKRPRGEGEFDETPTGLSFQDSNGVIHKALGTEEKLFTSGEDFSVGKIIRAKLVGNYEGLNDFEIKAAGEGIGNLGGWLVPETVSAKILDLSRNFARVVQAGAGTLIMTAPEMKLVKITGDPTAYFKAEHSPITESDWTLEDLNLKAMKCGVLVRASLELLEDAKNAGSALEMAMGAAIGLAMDRVALRGDGVNEPLGIDHAIPAGNIISMGANGAGPTAYSQLSESLEAVAVANGEATAFIMNPRSFYQYDRLLAATTNNRLEKPLSVQKIFDAGKMYHTNQVLITDTQGTSTDASKVYAGDFKQMIFGILKGLRFEFTREGGTGTFAQYEALIRAVVRFDIGILRDNHFSKIEGLIP